MAKSPKNPPTFFTTISLPPSIEQPEAKEKLQHRNTIKPKTRRTMCTEKSADLAPKCTTRSAYPLKILSLASCCQGGLIQLPKSIAFYYRKTTQVYKKKGHQSRCPCVIHTIPF